MITTIVGLEILEAIGFNPGYNFHHGKSFIQSANDRSKVIRLKTQADASSERANKASQTALAKGRGVHHEAARLAHWKARRSHEEAHGSEPDQHHETAIKHHKSQEDYHQVMSDHFYTNKSNKH